MSGRYGLRQAFLKMAKDMAALLDRLFRHPSTMIAVGVGAFLLFVSETAGTAQELPRDAIDASDRAAIKRSGLEGSVTLPLRRRTLRQQQALVDGSSMTLLGSALSSSSGK